MQPFCTWPCKTLPNQSKSGKDIVSGFPQEAAKIAGLG